jgi:hypothetical protein
MIPSQATNVSSIQLERELKERDGSFAPDTKVKCKSKIKTFSVLDPIGKEGTNSNTPRSLPNE